MGLQQTASKRIQMLFIAMQFTINTNPLAQDMALEEKSGWTIILILIKYSSQQVVADAQLHFEKKFCNHCCVSFNSFVQ